MAMQTVPLRKYMYVAHRLKTHSAIEMDQLLNMYIERDWRYKLQGVKNDVVDDLGDL